MGLQRYQQKRHFEKTPEPSGKAQPSKGELKFVVQKHAASHLHYDFRLELEGVLKSWAVPKGPSLDPSVKRLAMMVEDHPMDYRTFEGIIPKGNYGAGTVMVWDEGTYEFIDGGSRKLQEKNLLAGLHKGHLSFVLKGKKLKGEFSLIKTSSRAENAWLLIKKEDDYASTKDVTKQNKSVVTKRTLDEIKENAEKEKAVWHSNRSSDGEEKKEISIHLPKIKAGSKSKMPHQVKPMLATLTDEPFDKHNWIFEVKWDGYRAIAEINKGEVSMYSRNLLSFNERFAEIKEELEKLPYQAIFDGEVIAVNNDGIGNFQLLQQHQKTGEGTLLYYVFDLIYFNGFDLTGEPLKKRKEILQKILPAGSSIRYSDHIENEGIGLFEVSKNENLEGIIAKDALSEYSVGTRSKKWLKIKTQQRQEAVIAGYTEGRGGRKHFGALVLGVYDGDELKYIGHTGGGFNEKLLKDTFQKLKKLKRKTSPFKSKIKTNTKVTWVKPQLVCEVSFQEWTSEGIMRQPIFQGLRIDKSAKDVVRETPKSKEGHGKLKLVHSEKKSAKANGLLTLTEAKDQVVKVDKQELKFTNLNKLLWKKEKYTKRTLIEYYDQISPYILPYLEDRPQSLNRHPNGIESKNFFQKNVKGKVEDWIKTVPVYSDSNKAEINYMICNNKATLLYMANLGCIEINPWHSRIRSLDFPDYMVIDLDPEDISFNKVIDTALAVKEVLDEAGIDSYCKTSGASGLHICIPLGAKYNYDQAKEFGHVIVQIVHNNIPRFTSLERSPKKRQKKVYLDYLQNRYGQTIAAPYCVRPKPLATVSAPLHWDEVRKGLSPQQFTIKNIFDRIDETGDIFKPVLGKGIDMEKCLENISKMFK